jgi:G3E family GTPase
MIPVTVLTGFLGSGKTTLLAGLLKSPQFSRTAVIINEFGEVGLDHELIETSDESFVELQTGCLCCKMRGDLVVTLEHLLARRDAGTAAPFARVVIETSGLADPAPILHALMGDAGLAERLSLAGVVTTVDAVNGLATLARQPESVKQVALADRLLLTKTDLADAGTELRARLSAINPSAPVLTASFGEVDAERLLDPGLHTTRPQHLDAWLGLRLGQQDAHDAEISTFAVVRETPIAAVALTLFMEALAEHCGGDLLRLKGIVDIVESPDRPAVVHGVQHVFHPPAWLARWPSEDRRSRLVLVGRALHQPWFEALLAAIEAEVAEATAPT